MKQFKIKLEILEKEVVLGSNSTERTFLNREKIFPQFKSVRDFFKFKSVRDFSPNRKCSFLDTFESIDALGEAFDAAVFVDYKCQACRWYFQAQ